MPRSNHNPTTRYTTWAWMRYNAQETGRTHSPFLSMRPASWVLQLLVTQRQIGWAQVPIVMIQRVNVQREAAIVTRSFRP